MVIFLSSERTSKYGKAGGFVQALLSPRAAMQATYDLIVHAHGGVRESQPGYSESQIAIWSMLFF